MTHKSSILKIAGELIGIMFLFIVLSFVYMFVRLGLRAQRHKGYEKQIIEQLFSDLKERPDVQLVSYTPIDGAVAASVKMKNQDVVSLTLFTNKLNFYFHSFPCFDSSHKYVWMVPLHLEANSELSKWFPYTVTNIRELADQYENVKKVFESLPERPTNESVYIENIDPKYELPTHLDGKDVICQISRRGGFQNQALK